MGVVDCCTPTVYLPLPLKVHDDAEGGEGGQNGDEQSHHAHDRLGPHPVRPHAVVDGEGHNCTK